MIRHRAAKVPLSGASQSFRRAELVAPFPILAAQWALPAFSVVVAGLYLAGLLLRLRSGS